MGLVGFTQIFVMMMVGFMFPICSYLVFELKQDRKDIANWLAMGYGTGLYLTFFAPYWLAIFVKSKGNKLQQVVFGWLWTAYITAVTWELGWLVMHKEIAKGKDDPKFYTWWAYIDGGDTRYERPTIPIFIVESLTITMGAIGFLALLIWYTMPKLRVYSVIIFMGISFCHMNNTATYYADEILHGMPHVDTTSKHKFFNIFFKFIVANSPWLVMPMFVIRWGMNWIVSSHRPQTEDAARDSKKGK